jgi:hypothetical protein
MEIPIQPLSGHDLMGIVMFITLFGGGALVGIVAIIVHTWKELRKFRLETMLKRDMIQQGRSADEIERIIKATATPEKPGDAAKAEARRPAKTSAATSPAAPVDGPMHAESSSVEAASSEQIFARGQRRP